MLFRLGKKEPTVFAAYTLSPTPKIRIQGDDLQEMIWMSLVRVHSIIDPLKVAFGWVPKTQTNKLENDRHVWDCGLRTPGGRQGNSDQVVAQGHLRINDFKVERESSFCDHVYDSHPDSLNK